jgi:hypothetical protein
MGLSPGRNFFDFIHAVQFRLSSSGGSHALGPCHSGTLAWAGLVQAGGKRTRHRVVTVFPDRMERYFTHKVFEGLRCG